MSTAGLLDRDLPVPLYHQLQTILKAEIESGRWAPGEQIPTESQLVQNFAVSKITVRQAIHQLVEMQYLRRQPGRGTFVSKRKFDQGPRELTSFTEEMKGHSLVATSRILSQKVEEAGHHVAEALGIPAHSAVLVLKRLRLADNEPLTVQTAYIPEALVPGLSIDAQSSLYDVLRTRYHLYAARARETYVASTADRSSRTLLKLEPGAPVFEVERVTYLPNGKPFELVHSVIRGDRYSIVLDLEKRDQRAAGFSLRRASGQSVRRAVR
jgi:GntR family transcriptional regulator